jgi:hypothetical protein
MKTISERLREFNAWRRGAETEQPNSTEIGLLIECAADRLEVLERESARLRQDLAASDAALRESRENDAISTATGNALREQVRTLADALEEVILAADGEGWVKLDAQFSKQRTALATLAAMKPTP